LLILMGAKALATSWREKPPEMPEISQKQIRQLEPLKEKVLGQTDLEEQAEDLLGKIKKFPEEQIKRIKNEFDYQFWGKLIEVENE